MRLATPALPWLLVVFLLVSSRLLWLKAATVHNSAVWSPTQRRGVPNATVTITEVGTNIATVNGHG